MFAQNLLSTTRKRKAQDSIVSLRRGHEGSKARKILFEEENSIQNIAAAVVCSSTKLERKEKGPVEQRDCLWWQHGYLNWINEQFKRRFRVNRDTFNFILNAIEDLITKEVTIQRTGIARSPTWINYVNLCTV